MFKLKLIKGRSYTGYGVRATAEVPCIEVEKEDVADSLVATGYFSLIEAGEVTSGANPETEKPVEKMTEKELDVYAAENGIDLAGCNKKAEKLAKIQEALAAEGSDGDDGSDLFNDED